jgi:hypothetical protein
MLCRQRESLTSIAMKGCSHNAVLLLRGLSCLLANRCAAVVYSYLILKYVTIVSATLLVVL